MSNPGFKFDHVHIISQDPEASANWYVEMLGATITANTRSSLDEGTKAVPSGKGGKR
jgi:catechol 2,3-dioxygenase-like lactoylglutathione lyase family enzyme